MRIYRLMLTSARSLQNYCSEWSDNTIFFAVFLAALDQTIAAVALPTIVRDIGGQSGYSWIGSAYLLSASAQTPFAGVGTHDCRLSLAIFSVSLYEFHII